MSSKPATRRISLEVPDLGEGEKNAAIDTMFETIARNLFRVTDETGNKR